MRRFLPVLLLPLLLLRGAGSWLPDKAQAHDDPFIVHEWGTFTSFEGADGATVDGMQHETETLPAFVHTRLSPRTSALALYGDHSRDVPVRRCRGKMETPVIYFHTKRARHVNVHVAFAGLLSQWYPRAAATPALTGSEAHDLADVAESTLDWDLDVVPRMSGEEIPQVDPKSDWQKAREVDAASVRAQGENERYVFYRGLMRTAPQPSVTSLPGSTFVVNGDGTTTHAAFLLETKKDTARFVALGPLSGTARVVPLAETKERPKAEVVTDLETSMVAALTAEGLYLDEARAMVRTWSETWFAAEGTRLLHLVPRAAIDQALPLRITPTPDAVVRVIVGRVELLPPEKEAEIASAVPRAAAGDAASLATIAALGRFAEPALHVVRAHATEPAARAAADQVLAKVTSP